jgi:hypothetical protein
MPAISAAATLFRNCQSNQDWPSARHSLDFGRVVQHRAEVGFRRQIFEGFVAKIIQSVAAGVTLAVAAIALTGAAIAQDDFPLKGNYTQNVACKGDGSDAAAVMVKISSKEIVSNIGVCTILDLKQEGQTTTAHVECKFPAGPLVGDISFTPRPDKTVQFVDRDGNYKAILYPCPN